MPTFIKNNSKAVQPVSAKKEEITEEDILSPFYFPPLEDQMRQKEVAEMFSTTVQTIINWNTSGKIPSFRLGKTPIYSRKLLIYYARNNRNLLRH